MGQFDLTIRHLLSKPKTLKGLLKALFKIKYTGIEKLDSNLTVPNLRQVDFLIKGIDPFKRKCIVQLEFQSDNQAKMAERMEGYGGAIKIHYPDYVVYQVVIYIGFERLTMVDYCEEGFYRYQFYLKDIRELPVEAFLTGNAPELAILGVLSKPMVHQSPERFVEAIVRSVDENVSNEKSKKILLGLLSNLVKLRNLTTTFIEVMKKLELKFDESVYMHDDYFRKIVEARKAEGKAEGKAEMAKDMVLRFWREFNYSAEQIAALLAMKEGDVLKILMEHGCIDKSLRNGNNVTS